MNSENEMEHHGYPEEVEESYEFVLYLKRFKKCNIYTRVSSTKQSKFNTSSTLDSQAQICKKFANANQLRVQITYQDIASAWKPMGLKKRRECMKKSKVSFGKRVCNRDMLNRAINELDNKTCLLVYDVSRFCRNVKEFEDIVRRVEERDSDVYAVHERLSYRQNPEEFYAHVLDAQKE